MRSLALLALVVSTACDADPAAPVRGDEQPIGKGDIIVDFACPDVEDPRVDYVSHDPGFCAVALHVCAEGEMPFSSECGCGCVAPDDADTKRLCPDDDDPSVDYVSHSPEFCARVGFSCSEDWRVFNDDCGCGCVTDETLGCPDAGDPAVSYISHDPDTCAVVRFSCEAGQQPFSDGCGCGCEPLAESAPA